MKQRQIAARTRSPLLDASQPGTTSQMIDWTPDRSAVIVCDMWDAHHCRDAERRVTEMAPRMNHVLGILRSQDALIVHAPSSCMDFYRGTRGRRLADQARHAKPPAPIDWQAWNPAREGPLPPELADPGACSCATAEPCSAAVDADPWTRQIATIDIADSDAISDDGQEIFNLLEQRQITDVLVMGVHTNVCVLGRPFGIRQLVYLGKRPLLCRDLTDSFHRWPAGHAAGTELIVSHIEAFWCPTVTSDQLVGGEAFVFDVVAP